MSRNSRDEKTDEDIAFNAILQTVFMVVVAAVIFFAGTWWGSSSTLDAERIAAQNEVTHEVVRVGDEPRPAVIDLAKSSCVGDSNYDYCVSQFLAPFAPTYVVDLVNGTYMQITANNEER